MRPIYDLVNDVEDDKVRKNLLENIPTHKLNELKEKLSISSLFVWSNTKQGHEYWRALSNKYSK